MSSNSPGYRPPLIASWLIGLFTSGWHGDAIPGDLLKEFSEVASKSGFTCARRWYWRQSMKTVVELMGAGLRTAPWLVASTVIGGYLLLAFGFSLPEKLIVAVLKVRRHHVIPYYTQREMDAYASWFKTGILAGRFVVSLLIGCTVALVAKAKEMVATLTLTFVLFALNVAAWFNMAKHWPERTLPLSFMLTNLAIIILIPMGGVMVREIRRATGRSHSRV